MRMMWLMRSSWTVQWCQESHGPAALGGLHPFALYRAPRAGALQWVETEGANPGPATAAGRWAPGPFDGAHRPAAGYPGVAGRDSPPPSPSPLQMSPSV